MKSSVPVATAIFFATGYILKESSVIRLVDLDSTPQPVSELFSLSRMIYGRDMYTYQELCQIIIRDIREFYAVEFGDDELCCR